MNYYPNNFYQNYPYGNIYSQYIPQQPQQNTNLPQTQQIQGLQGKVVDGEEMVKVAEIPFGGYGVFPKADLSEIYIKTWNNNGTTNILTYKPIEVEQAREVDTNALLLEKISLIENKLDIFTEQLQKSAAAVKAPVVSQNYENRKESLANGY